MGIKTHLKNGTKAREVEALRISGGPRWRDCWVQIVQSWEYIKFRKKKKCVCVSVCFVINFLIPSEEQAPSTQVLGEGGHG